MASFMSDIALKFLKQEDRAIPRLRQYKIPSKLSNCAGHILKIKRDFDSSRLVMIRQKVFQLVFQYNLQNLCQ